MSALDDDTGDTSAGVVLSSSDGRRHRLGSVEEGLEDGEKLDDVVESGLGVHVLDEDTGGEGSVGSDLSFRVRETEVDELEQRL